MSNTPKSNCVFDHIFFSLIVAIGAAIQAAALDKQNGAPKVLLRNVTPLSLGILCPPKPGFVRTLIKRNTPYPTEKTRIGKGCTVSQKTFRIPIYEGEQRTANGNTHLGTLKLNSGQQENGIIDITFRINIKGELSVKAIERETKKMVETVIERPKRFEMESISKMKEEIVELLKDVNDDGVPNCPKEKKLKLSHEKCTAAFAFTDTSIEDFSIYGNNDEQQDRESEIVLEEDQ